MVFVSFCCCCEWCWRLCYDIVVGITVIVVRFRIAVTVVIIIIATIIIIFMIITIVINILPPPPSTPPTALMVGAVMIGVAFFAKRFGGLIQAAITITGVMGGPMLGLFILGILVPHCDRRGAFVGLVTSAVNGFAVVVFLWIFFFLLSFFLASGFLFVVCFDFFLREGVVYYVLEYLKCLILSFD